MKLRKLLLVVSFAVNFYFLFGLFINQINAASPPESNKGCFYKADIPEVKSTPQKQSKKQSKPVTKPKAQKPKSPSPKSSPRSKDLEIPQQLEDNKGCLLSSNIPEVSVSTHKPIPPLFSKYFFQPLKKGIKDGVKNLSQPNPRDFSFLAFSEGFFGEYDVEHELADLGGGPADKDHKLKEKFFGEGRFAYFFKGTLWEKYSIISSLDTKHDEAKIFRNLEDDKYYPTYGDDSTITELTPTQGKFYFKAERDESYFLWGNYNTGFTGSELASYNRSLYGSKVKFESLTKTKFETPKNVFIGYTAKARQLAAHDEMASTGGSLYYLRHKRVIEGSEKVYLLTRDKTTFLTKSSLVLTPDDYDIDYDDGRIILHNPASLTVAQADDSLVETSLPTEDYIYVIADYEYEPDGYFYNPSYGIRYSHEFGDNVKLGTTYVKEVESDLNYNLYATDALLRLNDKNTSNVELEYASSEANTLSNSFTTNGGLSFTEITNPTTSNKSAASAWKVKLNLDVKDFLKLEPTEATSVSTYFQTVEPGFSSTGTVSQDGTEKYGVEIKSELSKKTDVSIKHDSQRTTTQANGTVYTAGLTTNPITDDYLLSTRSEITAINVSQELTPKARLSQEYRHQELANPTSKILSERSDFGATKLNYQFNDDFSAYAQQQYTFRGTDNNLTTVGLSKTFTVKAERPKKEDKEGLDETKDQEAKITLGVEESFGNMGDATKFSVSKSEPDGSTKYLSYSLSPTTTGDTATSISLGQRMEVSDETSVYQEDVFNNNYSSAANNSRVMGLDYEPQKLPGLKIGGSYEKAYLDDEGGATYKDACSVSATYLKEKKINASSKFEVRNNKSNIAPHRQYLTINKLEYRFTPDLRFFGKADYSTSTDTDVSNTDAHLQEYNLGLAFRPTKFDKLNLITRYTHVVDDASPGQTDQRSIDESISDVYAVEGMYDITPKLSLTEKYAVKNNKELGTGDDSHIKSITDLILSRLSYNFFQDYHFDIEHRILTQDLAQDQKEGILIELSKPIFKYFVVGVGYNFVDFNDKLVEYMDSYTAQGPFFRVSMKLFEADNR